MIYRSPFFDTERLAREDYEQFGDKSHTNPQADAPVQEESAEVKEGVNTAPAEDTNSAGTTAPEGEVNAGTVAPEAEEANTNA